MGLIALVLRLVYITTHQSSGNVRQIHGMSLESS